MTERRWQTTYHFDPALARDSRDALNHPKEADPNDNPAHDDGEESLLLVPDGATFEILTWCSDDHGQVPGQVHLII